MSEERKDEEEIVEQGSSSQSTESGHMVDAHVQQEESPQSEEHEEEEHEIENHSGNSESSFSDEGGKEADDQLNGDYNYSPKPTVDGDGTSSSEDTKDEEDDRLIDEGHESFVETQVVPATGGVSKEGEENMVGLKEMKESKNVDELKGTEELKGVGQARNELKPVVENRMMDLNGAKEESFMKREVAIPSYSVNTEGYNHSFPSHLHMAEGDSGTDAEQAAFTRELEIFFRERGMDFKHPKFYGEGLNCLKLWRAVTRLGGYDRVTACKLWRQVGESFHPPKTCTTVSWSFRIFYEKALLDFERHKMRGGELVIAASPHPEPMGVDSPMGGQGSGSGRARRDAAARAMQGWHSQKLLGNGEVGDPIFNDKSPLSTPKREKHLKSVGLLKRKKPSILDRPAKSARTSTKVMRPQIDPDVADIGPAADWVKISVRRTKDCFEVYALVPGLLREEVRVQSDPAGRLVISGEPEQPDNPWGVTPFKKVITLPSRIDPHQTSAVVTLHGQLFVRVPFEQTDL